jgi:hypothetical protein
MTTFLDLVNEVLLQVGEREVPNFSSAVGRKAKLAVRGAVIFCQHQHDWRFTNTTLTVDLPGWSNGTATLSDMRRLHSVYLDNFPLRRVSSHDYYPADTGAGVPNCYAIVGENQVRLWPIPSDAIKPTVQFNVSTSLSIPVNETDVLNYPESFKEILSLYAQASMHRTHTTDMAALDACLRSFELLIHTYRSSEQRSTTANMGGQ